MTKKVLSDEETVIPDKVIKGRKVRIEVVEETIKCPICKTDVVFKIRNKYIDRILKKSEREQETWTHDPMECLQDAPTDFETKFEVDKCSNCKNWAGSYGRCGDRSDEYCNKHSRTMTKREYNWIKRVFPEKLKRWVGDDITFEDTQVFYHKLKYVCFEDHWCAHYEDDK